MIILQAPNLSPYVKSGNAKKVIGPTLPDVIVNEVNEICICDYISCQYTEKVFAEIGGADYKNDSSEFIFKRFINSDTVELILEKDGIEVDQLDDDDLGELFDGFPSGNDDQKKYFGYRLDWQKVLQLHGAGSYKVKANLKIIGVESVYESRQFLLLPYSDLNAEGTVKIESMQNGNIFGNEFDFTGLEWKQFIRIPAVFGNPTPTIETDRYLDSNKVYRQIKSKVSREWTLATKLINWEVAEKLIYNKLMANEILITDYNIKSEKVWRKINVKAESIEKPTIYGNPNRNYIIKFVDNKSIFEKTNY